MLFIIDDYCWGAIQRLGEKNNLEFQYEILKDYEKDEIALDLIRGEEEVARLSYVEFEE